MSKRYSAFNLAVEGLRGHGGWRPVWRRPRPQPAYDVAIIGGGGHGLATAYYLAKLHGVRRVAVIEKGWLGGGNTGRNTTAVRSNYFYPESVALYDLALRLYEGLSRELNYNIMLSQRGIVNVAHSDAQMEICARLVNAMQINGVDAELFGPEARSARRAGAELRPASALSSVWRRLASPRRHRPTRRRGLGLRARGRRARRRHHPGLRRRGLADRGRRLQGRCHRRGDDSGRAGRACRGLAFGDAGRQGRIRTAHAHLHACRRWSANPSSRPSTASSWSLGTGTYVSQSDKGELVFGGGIDRVTSFAQRGNPPALETIVAGLLEPFPAFGQLKLMRHWAGAVDVVPDSSPLIGPSPVPNLFLNCGWGTGGFKAIPAGGWLLAHLLAKGEHHPISRPFDLDRFERGALIDEAAGSGIAH